MENLVLMYMIAAKSETELGSEYCRNALTKLDEEFDKFLEIRS